MNDWGAIGECAAKLMDKVEGYGETATVRDVIILVEVTEDDGATSFIDWYASTADAYKQAGLLAAAARSSLKGFQRDVS